MSTMVVELYEALKAAGAPEDKAQAAAAVLVLPSPGVEDRFTAMDSRFDRVDTEFATLKTDVTTIKVKLTSLAAEVGFVRWVVSGVGFGILTLIVKSFWPA